MVNGVVTCRLPEVIVIDEEYDDEDMKEPEDHPTGSSDEDEDDVRSEYSGPYPATSPKIQIQEYNGRRQVVKTIITQNGSRMFEETSDDEDLLGNEL